MILFDWIEGKLNDSEEEHESLENIFAKLEELNEAPEVEAIDVESEKELTQKKKAGRKSEEKFVPSDELKKKV